MSETNVNTKLSLVQKIEQSVAGSLAALPEVGDRFKSIYQIMNGGNKEVAAAKYDAEKFHYMKLIQDTPALQQCTKLSLYGCFMDMAVNGLSFDKSMKHAYVVSFNTNAGTKQSPKWEKRATLMISGYGELHMRVRQGQIKHADNPILVFEGDHFQHGTKNDKVFLEHVAAFPRKSEKIIACYIRIQRNDDTVDYKVLGIDEVMKFREFSKDKESLAWTAGLPGMVQAKTLKHAFRSYPKMRMGEFTMLQSQVVDTESEQLPAIDYGLGDQLPEANGAYQPTMVITPAAEVREVQQTKQPLQPVYEQATADDDFAQQTQPAQSSGKVFHDDDF